MTTMWKGSRTGNPCAPRFLPGCDALPVEQERDDTAAVGHDALAVILVEGDSDREAIETLATRRGRDLAAERVVVLSIGGVTNTRRWLEQLGPHGRDLRLAGLCDAGEAALVERALERAEVAPAGFYVCRADLEDELLRALGVERVEQVLEADGELASFRILQRQPAQRDRSTHDRLRRFMGTRSGRKIRYGRLLVEALDLDHVPAPLDAVLEHVYQR
jgi:hypothetical protein